MKPCPKSRTHTPCPEGYMQWHSWASRKMKTHKQIKCKGCGLWHVWILKKAGKAQR
jgi:hypothetical protein